jgi:hypothetical protein
MFSNAATMTCFAEIGRCRTTPGHGAGGGLRGAETSVPEAAAGQAIRIVVAETTARPLDD